MDIRRTICLFIGIISLLILSCRVSAVTYDPVRVEIPVTVGDVIPDASASNYDYFIAIEKLDPLYPDPVLDTIQIPEMHVRSFVFNIDQPGTYVYRVLEQKSDSTAYVHDKRVYLVTIYAEAESDDKLKTAVSSSDVNGDKPDLILFEDKIAGDNIPDPHPNYDPFYPHDDPGEPVVTAPKPAEDASVPEDPSSGAPSFGDGLFIDVGTFVKMIDPPATEAEKQEIAMLEESFIGGIPVLYLVCAIVLPLIGVIVSRCSKKKE